MADKQIIYKDGEKENFYKPDKATLQNWEAKERARRKKIRAAQAVASFLRLSIAEQLDHIQDISR